MSIRSVTSVTPGADAGGDRTTTAATASMARARITARVSTVDGTAAGTVTAITAGDTGIAGDLRPPNWGILVGVFRADVPAGRSIRISENSGIGWPSFGEHVSIDTLSVKCAPNTISISKPSEQQAEQHAVRKEHTDKIGAGYHYQHKNDKHCHGHPGAVLSGDTIYH